VSGKPDYHASHQTSTAPGVQRGISLQINVCVAVSCDQVLRNLRIVLRGLGLRVYWLCRYLSDPAVPGPADLAAGNRYSYGGMSCKLWVCCACG
jgi:hypothetical protein